MEGKIEKTNSIKEKLKKINWVNMWPELWDLDNHVKSDKKNHEVQLKNIQLKKNIKITKLNRVNLVSSSNSSYEIRTWYKDIVTHNHVCHNPRKPKTKSNKKCDTLIISTRH